MDRGPVLFCVVCMASHYLYLSVQSPSLSATLQGVTVALAWGVSLGSHCQCLNTGQGLRPPGPSSLAECGRWVSPASGVAPVAKRHKACKALSTKTFLGVSVKFATQNPGASAIYHRKTDWAPNPRPPPPPSTARPTPGVVKQDKSSGGSVDTTKTRSGPQRIRMSSGERPIGAAKSKQSDTEALCQSPPPTSGSASLPSAMSTVT